LLETNRPRELGACDLPGFGGISANRVGEIAFVSLYERIRFDLDVGLFLQPDTLVLKLRMIESRSDGRM